MPTRVANLEVEFERRGRLGKIKFAARDRMGTAVSGSEKVYRVRYHRGFFEFGITGMRTLQILTLIFTKASRNIFNIIELSLPAQWEPEQDFSRDMTELVPPQRTVQPHTNWREWSRSPTTNQTIRSQATHARWRPAQVPVLSNPS
jgi:hypothetical protein